MLVWYDELVTKFEPIPRILDFFDLRYDISDFDVEEHRKCSLSIYDDQHRSFTKNNPKDLTYHQRTVESAVLEAIDEYVQNHHADLLDKYGLLRHDNLTQT
ncbi:hypothetical protein KFU94_30080 [Chloroflexi bacterium TSY]|nr:hypothetical protein [Chloroflexi bacterium TSY]